MNHIINEAKLGKNGGYKAELFGIPVVSSSQKQVLENIVMKIREKDFAKPLFIATAYSEFFTEAQRNPRFAHALHDAGMVVPDGVIVMAAKDYLNQPKMGIAGDLISGLAIGRKILSGDYKDRVVGVRLVEILLKLAVQNKYRVFLLGGWNGVSARLAEKWKEKGLNVEWDEGFKDVHAALTHTTISRPIVEKINKFKPDVLLVALGRFKQELWIDQQKDNLKASVVIGVGSSFDELAGEGVWMKPTPEWVEKRGLKWLWRALHDRKHLKRAWNAFPVFAWKVFIEKRKNKN